MSHMDYESMLQKAKKEMPNIVQEKQRFEIPPVKGHLQGNKTVLSNLQQIASHVHRPVEHIFKFLLKELAAPGEVRGQNAVLGRKISASECNGKITQYAEEYVFCAECGKPDTEFIKEGNLLFMKCMVCGAKNPIRSRI